MKDTVRAFWLVLLIVAVACALTAQTRKKPPAPPKAGAQEQMDPLQGSPKIITATRQVTLFWQIENDLSQALQKKDQTALNKLLPEDFRLWMPNQTGSAISREDWTNSGMETPFPTQLRQMSAHEYPDIMVVKFIGQEKTPAKGSAAKQYFVVDVWARNGDAWELNDRYMTPIAPIQMPKRPSGKE